MSPTLERTEIPCALCGPGVPYRIRYPERIEGPLNFAARKTPARQHFRIVECRTCGLIWSNAILPFQTIGQLYRQSPFIEERQLDSMVRDYQAQVQAILPLLEQRDRLLEIGCSSGFFLKAARELGFREVWGVEPGVEARQRAEPSIRARIVNAFFQADLFPAESFDLVCGFQVLDHLPDPNTVLRDVFRLLRPGGLVLLLHHNIRSWLPRFLGERCPMYDVEHIYLFDPSTAACLLRKQGFEVVSVSDTPNRYTLDYALKMFPLPNLLKSALRSATRALGVDQWCVRLAAGNMVTLGRKGKPASGPPFPEGLP